MLKKISFQLIRISYFFAGIFITSLAIVLLVQSHIGADPWSVLHVGISLHIPITTGRINQLIGTAIIFVCLALNVKPVLGTIINTYFIGFFIDLINRSLIVNPAKSPLWSCIYLITGILLFGTGTGIYSNFGNGSRDNLIIGLAKLTGKSITIIKIIIELIIIIIGAFLGGPFGMGTFIFMLLVENVIQWSQKKIKPPSYEVQQSKFSKPL